METKFTFNTNGNSNKVKYVLNTSDNQEIEFTEQDLKLLQVLKDKLPHITTLRVMEYEDTYEFYNSINITSITKEEYELLKEWLNG